MLLNSNLRGDASPPNAPWVGAGRPGWGRDDRRLDPVDAPEPRPGSLGPEAPGRGGGLGGLGQPHVDGLETLGTFLKIELDSLTLFE